MGNVSCFCLIGDMNFLEDGCFVEIKWNKDFF